MVHVHARWSVLLSLAMTSLLLLACSDDAPGGDTVITDVEVLLDEADEGTPDVVVSLDSSIDTSPDADTTHDTLVVEYASEFESVIIDPAAPTTLQLAVRACAGLYNRKLGGSVYVQMDAQDAYWLEALELVPSRVVEAQAFLDECLATFPTCIRYSYDEQQTLLPNIITIGGVLGAVPLDVGMPNACDEVVFDATIELAELTTPYLATQYVFEHYVAETTGLAMTNPGYETWNPSDVTNPALIGDMRYTLVDYVFSRKLFVHFLVNGCVDGNPEKELLHDIVNAGHWPTPLGVYGYNNSWMVMGGYLYEAQTTCLDSRNMGAIPSETVNLSFFSTRRPPITDASQLPQSTPEEIEYDPSKTYVAFVVGDGDNLRFIMTTRNQWLEQRLEECAGPGSACPPITWSISPHLPYIAPDVLEWYYQSSQTTGSDYFILPPSGHLYAYPTSLADEDQDRFVAATEEDARILGVHGTVHWDWFDSWKDAEALFLPKYAKQDGTITGIFPINVPYLFPTFTWWPSEQFYKVLTGDDGGEVVVFRPRQWRGIDDSDEFFLSPEHMADELAAYPPGTITWVYMTSDGGLTLENSFMDMLAFLPPHVQLISADTAASLASSVGD